MRGALSPRPTRPSQVPATRHPPRLLIAESRAQVSQPACGSYLRVAGRQPRDVPTHGSPAATRQANARVRPRAAVSGPAHRPRPAQPSAPAPAGNLALNSPADSCPCAGLLVRLGTGVLPCSPVLGSSRGQWQHPGVWADISGIPFPGWLCPSPPPHSSLCPSLGLSLRQLAPVPGLGAVVPCGSVWSWGLPLGRLSGSSPSHCPGTYTGPHALQNGPTLGGPIVLLPC